MDSTFQSEIIEAEIKNLKERLLNMKKTELIYHWNLPHCCFRLIVPLLSLRNFTQAILTGLCISVGGISESIQKFSEKALIEYIHENKNLENVVLNVIAILEMYAGDERVLIPLFKSLSLILQREEVQHSDGVKELTGKIFQLVYKETHKSQSINKVAASV